MNINISPPFLLILFCLLAGCSYHPPVSQQQNSVLYLAPVDKTKATEQHPPNFLIHADQDTHNRIGTAAARLNKWNEEEIYIDDQHPTIYHAVNTFRTERAKYTNHIYRIHFPETPFSLFPFYLSSGNNPGLLTIITLNLDGKPILVTTVHTCGCYLAIIPTNFLAKDAFPLNWKHETIDVYGEDLPALLDFNSTLEPSLLLEIRPDIHRVMGIKVMNKKELTTKQANIKTMLAADLSFLEQIPLAGGTTSFFHQDGIQAGHVKNSIKGWESLLLSLISLDLFVGTDKKYDFNFQTKNNFYTSLKPWNRTSSDMRDFAKFLQFWGWKL